MTTPQGELYAGKTRLHTQTYAGTGEYVTFLNETYYRIRHYDQMPPFLMNLVSNTDHWLFIASNGGMTAGRINADFALFPYETEDKLAAHAEQTGGKSVLRVTRQGRTYLWEPFSRRYDGVYRSERHLYKNIYGDKLIFEEINHDLRLTLRIAWRTGDRFGFIKSGWLRNDGDDACHVDLLDGLRNVLPYGATAALQTSLSSLLHAYKRNELDPATGLGIFALSATLTDHAEPSESLKASAVWQIGLDARCHLLCDEQLDAFRQGRPLTPEQDLCGKAGAYFVYAPLTLDPRQEQRWHMAADVNLDSAALVRLERLLRQDAASVEKEVEADIARGTQGLVRYVAAADGLQVSARQTTTAHHFANVLFNVMRGGIFAHGYQIERADWLDFARVRNRAVLDRYGRWFADLPAQMTIHELHESAAASNAPDLLRLSYEYLPLTFSRRHGDPSRPWNHFSINLKKADGSPHLDYQGNWRDIFQNWEPLALSFPAYLEGIIAKFLNATTADGYNPYRITRAGIEWESPEPDNPWANIGYWSDHQIIYLQKLLEIAEQVRPGALAGLWNRPIFAYANVPYRLRPYQAMLADWYNTIVFDEESERQIEAAVADLGTDARLHRDDAGNIMHVTLAEKLLVLLLAKLTNLVPEGGIWMNTQRPEWNDANNALVGKGLSVVTTAYLRRFIAFWQTQLRAGADEAFAVNSAVADLFARVQATFAAYQPCLATGFDGTARRGMMDELGAAATAYRATIYAQGPPASQRKLPASTLANFLSLAQTYIEHTLRANRRPDNLYHAYNILRLEGNEVRVGHLYPMLEGQVAILSAGLLPAAEVVTLLHSLRHSDLYRADQHSYLLYPHRTLPGFRQKNNIAAAQVADSALVRALTANGDHRLLIRDENGAYHFNGAFRNASQVVHALDNLARESAYADLVSAERAFILDLFEATFNHHAFTGRSGTFFAYEGLGSIYWHMVAKLLLAVQENYLAAVDGGEDAGIIQALAHAYTDIRQGLGFNKSPAAYGAFPTDPYSHTPAGAGARQPGMTGQVKEEILTRWGELGVFVRQGALHFAPTLLREEEFLPASTPFTYVDVHGKQQTFPLPVGSLAFTFCQTPVIYDAGTHPQITITYANGQSTTIPGQSLDPTISQHIFHRDGQIVRLQVVVTL
ncbi:MAG: hypothetical protein KC418_12235 [Anaerolineales bacterium]|nr:hypothetical protein [Anaerolineales bacterium]MCB8951553.1 hypothetical protein [Ardenticatenales bacterium]